MQENPQEIKNVLPSAKQEIVSSEFFEIPISDQESKDQNQLNNNKNRFQSQDSAFELNGNTKNNEQKGVLDNDSSRNFQDSIKLGSARVLKWAKKDHIQGRVFLIMFLDLLFPKVIRSYAVQICQIFLGIVVFAAALSHFIWLYVDFSQCKYYNIETAGIPENAVECKERLLEKQVMLGMNNNGSWSTGPSYKVNMLPNASADALCLMHKLLLFNPEDLLSMEEAFLATIPSTKIYYIWKYLKMKERVETESVRVQNYGHNYRRQSSYNSRLGSSSKYSQQYQDREYRYYQE